jgi:hypothetical protein
MNDLQRDPISQALVAQNSPSDDKVSELKQLILKIITTYLNSQENPFINFNEELKEIRKELEKLS